GPGAGVDRPPPAGPGVRHQPAGRVQPLTRVALVTGAARGIGAATVAALAAGGGRVVAADRCADDPAVPYRLGSREELAEVVAAAGEHAVAARADTRDP